MEEDDIFYNEGESLALDSIEEDYISEDEFHLENDNEADDSNSDVGRNSDFSDSDDEHIARQPLRLDSLCVYEDWRYSETKIRLSPQKINKKPEQCT